MRNEQFFNGIPVLEEGIVAFIGNMRLAWSDRIDWN